MQMIHIKCQALFSLKKKKKFILLSAPVKISILRVNLILLPEVQINKYFQYTFPDYLDTNQNEVVGAPGNCVK